jgi:hypothetical protein
MRAHMTGVITLCAFLLVANGGVEAAAVGEDAVAPMGAAGRSSPLGRGGGAWFRCEGGARVGAGP